MGRKITSLEDDYRTDAVAACKKALRLTRHSDRKERLKEIDVLLCGYGTEGIRGEWQNGYWCDIVASYVNMGDTYAMTVMEVRGDWSGASSHFIVTSYGDWVEKNQTKYGIQ